MLRRTIKCPNDDCIQTVLHLRELRLCSEPRRLGVVHYHAHCFDCHTPIGLPNRPPARYRLTECGQQVGEPPRETIAWYKWAWHSYGCYIPGQHAWFWAFTNNGLDWYQLVPTSKDTVTHVHAPDDLVDIMFERKPELCLIGAAND